MQNTLARRVSALEQSGASSGLSSILIHIVDVGELGREVSFLDGGDGRTWRRADAESEKAFIDRAAEELRAATPDRNRWWIAFLVGETTAA